MMRLRDKDSRDLPAKVDSRILGTKREGPRLQLPCRVSDALWRVLLWYETVLGQGEARRIAPEYLANRPLDLIHPVGTSSMESASRGRSMAMGSEGVLKRLEAMARPALRLVSSDNAGARSKFGGVPNLPSELEWPSWRGVPLAFLAQIDLSELPRSQTIESLPSDGSLYFFYHPEQETWGFDPNDRGSWSVLYSRERPTSPGRIPPHGLSAEATYHEQAMEFLPIRSLPDTERLDPSPGALSEEAYEEVEDLRNAPFEGQPKHQMGGYPHPVQNDTMELESQLASNGVYCGGPDWNDPRIESLEGGASEWKLLLQLDTDEDAGMMWGDAGMLYFWIRAEDLRRR